VDLLGAIGSGDIGSPARRRRRSRGWGQCRQRGEVSGRLHSGAHAGEQAKIGGEEPSQHDGQGQHEADQRR
jgi:hypothetical protein